LLVVQCELDEVLPDLGDEEGEVAVPWGLDLRGSAEVWIGERER
jgi:hypothetical protein